MNYSDLIIPGDGKNLDINNLTDSSKEILLRRLYIQESVNGVKSNSKNILDGKSNSYEKNKEEETRKIAEAFRQYADKYNFFPKNNETQIEEQKINEKLIFKEVLEKILNNTTLLLISLRKDGLPNNINKLYDKINKSVAELESKIDKEKTKNNKEKLIEFKKVINIFTIINDFLKIIEGVLLNDILLYHKKDILVKKLELIEYKIGEYLDV